MKLEIVPISTQNGAKETKMKRLNKKYFSDNRFDEIGADQMIHLDNPLLKNAHLIILDFSWFLLFVRFLIWISKVRIL